METRGINKKVLITVIALISATLFSMISILVVALFERNNNKQTNVEANVLAYDFKHGCFENENQDNYKNHKLFYISDPDGLNRFSLSVAKGVGFANKEVHLLDNIDMSEVENFVPIGAKMWDDNNNPTTKYNGKVAFEGTFNGQGYTVSNLKTKIETRDGGSGDLHLGFFAQIKDTAIVQNLKIDTFEISSYNHNPDVFSLVGGIAGYVNLTESTSQSCVIENCYVEDLIIHLKDDEGQSDVGGLVGYTKIASDAEFIIEKCAVQNFDVYSLYKFNNAGGLIGKTYCHYLKTIVVGGGTTEVSKFEINDCYVEDFQLPYSVGAKRTANISPACGTLHTSTVSDSGANNDEQKNDYFIYNISNCVVNCDNGYDNVKTSNENWSNYAVGNNIIDSNVTNNPKDFQLALETLNYNSQYPISQGGSEGSTWYFAADYNDGLPILRIAITAWSEIKFYDQLDNQEGVYKTSIYIPLDAFSNFHRYYDGNKIEQGGYTITIYDQEVTSQLSNDVTDRDCYSSNNWYIDISTHETTILGNKVTFTDDVIITAIYERILRDISFSDSDNDHATVTYNNVTDTNDDEPFINDSGSGTYGCGIYTVIISFSGIRAGIYTDVRIAIYNDSEKQKVSIVTYTAESGYDIISLKISSELGNEINETAFTNGTNLVLHGNVTFSVQTQQRQYEIEIG